MNPGYEMPLEDLKTWNLSLVNEVRDSELLEGYIDSNGNTWDVNESARSNLTGVCVLVALGVVTGDQVWRDKDNIDHTMTPAELVGLAGGMAVFIKTCYTNSWAHKATIEAMTDATTLQNYDIMTGWPH